MVELGAKYQQYEEYKQSGVEWLGEIPKDWDKRRLKFIFSIEKRIAGELGFNVLSVTQKGIKVKDTESGDGQLSMDYSKYQRVYIGDFAMNHMDLLTGYIDISKFDGVTSPDYRVFCIKDNISYDDNYYLYLLQMGYKQKTFFHLGQGSSHLGRWRLPTEAFYGIEYPVPNINEQVQIANFLDFETDQIDTLIEKQQTLIKLLKEKRQAVISHAVTKGLNPDAPMKDSEVEWLGDVPEHWEVSKLKYYSLIQGGYAFSSNSFIEDGVQILRIGNVYQNRLALERQPIFVSSTMLEALPDFIVKDGDIIMSLTGTLGKRDYGFAVKVEDDGTYLLNQRVAKLKPVDERINRDFLINVLWSESYLNQLYSLPSGTKQANLSNSDVLNILITLPPSKDEQKQIAKYLLGKTDVFNDTIEKAIVLIELLQERRTALISAAVTGKIDVRGWQAPE